MTERRVAKVCAQCSVGFDGRKAQRFCSRSCAARHTNTVRDAPVRPESCGDGHLFTEANTYTTRDGRRVCRECKRVRDRGTRRTTTQPSSKGKPAEVVRVETVPVLRPTWRPSGFVLRPGDEGYQDESREGIAS